MPQSYKMQGGSATKEKAWIQLIRRLTIFHLNLTLSAIQNTSFAQRFKQARQQPNDHHRAAYYLMVQECLPILERLAPETTAKGCCIEEFLHVEVCFLEFGMGRDGEVEILEGERGEGVAYDLLPTSIPSICKDLRRVAARKVVLDSSREDIDFVGGLTGKVATLEGETMFFKPREQGREKEFDRELDILCRLKELDLGLRVSELQAIVVTGSQQQQGEEEKVTGMLLKLIRPHPWGMHPAEKGFCGRLELHRKWEEQITATLRELHERGIVWGDVNPCNVIIDEDLNAWVIDFGGRNNAEFVDDDKVESVEGDWQGVERLFGEWLAERKIWPSGEIYFGEGGES